MDAPFTLLDDLLNRLTAIDLTVAGVAQAQPVFFEHPSRPPFPKTMHKIGRWYVERVGLPMYRLHVTVTKLLLGGPIGTGYTRNAEMALNAVYMALIAKYLNLPRLNAPDTGEPLPYLMPQVGAQLGECSGTIKLTFDPTDTAAFFGAEITHVVIFDIQQGRKA
jgi:hypothetical protein